MARASLRLLLVVGEGYPPRRADIVDLYAKAMSRRGHHIDWLIQSREARRQTGEEAYGGGRVWIGRAVGGHGAIARIGNALFDIRHDLRLFTLLRRRHYDAVIVRDKIVGGLIALAAARWCRTRLVFWMSYPTPEAALATARSGHARSPALSRLRGWASSFALYRVLLPRSDHILAQSEHMQRMLEARGLQGAKMTPVPMGVPLDKLPHPYPVTAVAKPEGESWIVYLGTLARVRGLERLIDALACVRAQVPEAKLHFVGSGDNRMDEEHLRRHAVDAGLAGHVVFTGRLEREHAWQYVALADVCVSAFCDIPILRQSSPTKLVEYMALGRPVVASPNPEQDRILADSGAGVSAPYTAEAFGKAIVHMLSNPAEADAMGQRGRAYVEGHRGYDTIAAFLDGRLREVLAP